MLQFETILLDINYCSLGAFYEIIAQSSCLLFLRGVGFTETQIEYLPSLLTPRSIQYSSLFISYAHLYFPIRVYRSAKVLRLEAVTG